MVVGRDRTGVQLTGPFLCEEIRVRQAIVAILLLIFGLPAWSCRPSARSQHSYDQIREMVRGKTAAEVEQLLGEPDVRESVLDDQRWIWWSYTFLNGNQYAPEIRGQIVHLEIILRNPSPAGHAAPPIADWRVVGPLSVSYTKTNQAP